MFSKVRLPPVKADPLGQAQLPDGMEVEVFSRAHETEENGWWLATIKMMKGDFAVVVYSGWDNNYTEIVSLDRLRLKSVQPPISAHTFHHFEIEVPEEYRDYAKLEGVHKEFQKAVGAIVCNYVPEKGALSLISRTDATQKRASMIQNMHFRNISQKAMLLKRTEEAVKQLESTKLHSTGGLVFHFIAFVFDCHFFRYGHCD